MALAAVIAVLAATAASTGIGRAQNPVSGSFGIAQLPSLTLLRSNTMSNGTVVLGGAMSSDMRLLMTGAFSVGDATSLAWDLPLIPSFTVSGLQQTDEHSSFSFNVKPDSSQLIRDSLGNPLRRFFWNHPPVNTVITVKETVLVRVATLLTPFHSDATLPLPPANWQTAPYLSVTPLVRLSRGAKRLIRTLQGHDVSEQSVVNRVADWVATHIRYRNRGDETYSAADVFRTRMSMCRGFDNLTAGLLRAVGIPVQVEYGWVSGRPLTIKGRQGSATIQWSTGSLPGELHSWLDIWFPDAGWVPFDPLLEKFFVDPRHVDFQLSTEAGDPAWGTWTAEVVPGSTPTGRNLANGQIEIVPGDDPAGQVQLLVTDSLHSRILDIHHDISKTLLFSR